MARVIKASGGKADSPRRPAARLGAPPAHKRQIIEKEVYKAQVRAQEIRKEAEVERERILVEGKRHAAQLREEAQSEGAAEAFAQAAAEALTAFRHRAARYADAADDIQLLALEVVRKILGHSPKLSERAVLAIIEQGMNRLRARRKLRVQLPESRLMALNRERPALVAAIHKEPDILLETVTDVSAGFCRVVTEVGGALCSEQAALDTLAESLNVDEKAVAPAPKSALSRLDEERSRDDEDDDDKTEARRPAPAPRQPERPRPVTNYRGVGLSVTAPDLVMPQLQDIQVAGPRVRPLDDAHDPDATMSLDVRDLREELDEKKPNDDDDDELDLHVDDSLPER